MSSTAADEHDCEYDISGVCTTCGAIDDGCVNCGSRTSAGCFCDDAYEYAKERRLFGDD